MRLLVALLVGAMAAFGLVMLLAIGSTAATDGPGLLLGVRIEVLPWAHYRITPEGYHLPDRRVTPGVVDLTDRAALCATTWGRDARHVTEAEKRAVTTAYGVPHKLGPGGVEIDHLCSRENCGRGDVVENLWPQPWAEAKLKDRVENRVHRAICQEQGDILRLQHQMIVDWTVLYRRWFGPLPKVKR